jgi:hypothetical protein
MIYTWNVSIPEIYNLRHFKTKHSYFNQKYSGEFRKHNTVSLVQTHEVQQNNFKKCSDFSEQVVQVSFEISHSSSHQGLLLKAILRRIVYLMHHKKLCCTNCMKKIEAISLNQITVQSQVDNISKDGETQLSEIYKCVWWPTECWRVSGDHLNSTYICKWP